MSFRLLDALAPIDQLLPLERLRLHNVRVELLARQLLVVVNPDSLDLVLRGPTARLAEARTLRGGRRSFAGLIWKCHDSLVNLLKARVLLGFRSSSSNAPGWEELGEI